MPSLTDVAQEAGVSLTTASMVLNKGKQHNRVSAACASRVQEAAKRLGYVPNYHARSMKLGKAEVLAVALDFAAETTGAYSDNLELSDPYYGHLLAGIERHIRSIGYLMTLTGPEESTRAPDRALMGVKQRRFDGIIVPGAAVRDTLTSFLTEPADCPVVVIDPNSPTIHPSVTFDERAGIDLAVHHLQALGHRHLLYVGDHANSQHNAIRQQQFSKTCAAAGIHCQVLAQPNFSLSGTEDLIAHAANLISNFFAADTDVTGVICFNDVVALGVVEGLMEAGLEVPSDVSVIGFDDTLARFATPRLTTISHKLHEMGARATELCMEMINDPAAIARLKGTQITIAPELITRASTAKPPARSGHAHTPITPANGHSRGTPRTGATVIR